jgi:hypothetical protein
MRKFVIIISLIGISAILVSCASRISGKPETPIASASSTETIAITSSYSSISPISSPVSFSSKTFLPTVMGTPIPSATPTAVPSSTPTSIAILTYPPYVGIPFEMVFLRGGDLWLSEVGGQGEQQLTIGNAISSYAISPDCDQIAYTTESSKVQQSTVNSVSLANKTMHLLTGFDEQHQYTEYSISWLNQSQVLFTVWETLNLVIFDLNTQEEATVTDHYLWHSPDNNYQVSCFKLRDLTTQEEWHIVENIEWGTFLGWSENNEYLLFSTNPYRSDIASELIAVAISSRNANAITPNDKSALLTKWSPDRKSVAVTLCDKRENEDRDQPPHNCDLWLIDVNGNNARPILDGHEDQNIIVGNWSPDGRLISFAQCNVGENIYTISQGCDLGVINVEEKEPIIVLPNMPFKKITGLDWTPNGSHLLFAEYTAYIYDIPNIWSFSLDQAELQVVISNAYDAQVVCEP